jgi:hypothetical protein
MCGCPYYAAHLLAEDGMGRSARMRWEKSSASPTAWARALWLPSLAGKNS